MREITPTLGLRATEAAGSENKLGIQVGEPVGHSRPPRVYMSIDEFPNAGVTAVVTQIMEAGGVTKSWEIPDPFRRSEGEKPEDKAAQCVQGFLDGFNPEDGGTLFLAGSEEMADKVIDRLNIPDDISIKINEGEAEYIPDPTS